MNAKAIPDLIGVTDPDWQSFLTSDPAYYLRVAGAAIRKYCGWHLWPSMTVTKTKLMTGSDGIVMLPSRYVTDVSQVVMENRDPGLDPVTLDPDSYKWFEPGWVQWIGSGCGWGWGWPGAYYYGPDTPYYLPVTNYGLADVTFTHGYDELPDDIKQVAFELTKGILTIGPGVTNVKEVQSPQYKTVFGQASGLTLNDQQKGRLANYRIGRFA
jgi:hypothetical protein